MYNILLLSFVSLFPLIYSAACPPTNCTYSDWSSWTQCNTNCNGIQYRRQLCTCPEGNCTTGVTDNRCVGRATVEQRPCSALPNNYGCCEWQYDDLWSNCSAKCCGYGIQWQRQKCFCGGVLSDDSACRFAGVPAENTKSCGSDCCEITGNPVCEVFDDHCVRPFARPVCNCSGDTTTKSLIECPAPDKDIFNLLTTTSCYTCRECAQQSCEVVLGNGTHVCYRYVAERIVPESCPVGGPSNFVYPYCYDTVVTSACCGTCSANSTKGKQWSVDIDTLHYYQCVVPPTVTVQECDLDCCAPGEWTSWTCTTAYGVGTRWRKKTCSCPEYDCAFEPIQTEPCIGNTTCEWVSGQSNTSCLGEPGQIGVGYSYPACSCSGETNLCDLSRCSNDIPIQQILCNVPDCTVCEWRPINGTCVGNCTNQYPVYKNSEIYLNHTSDDDDHKKKDDDDHKKKDDDDHKKKDDDDHKKKDDDDHKKKDDDDHKKKDDDDHKKKDDDDHKKDDDDHKHRDDDDHKHNRTTTIPPTPQGNITITFACYCDGLPSDKCRDPKPKNIVVPCNLSCPVCEWLEWSSWTPCSRTCGGGESYRVRECSCPYTETNRTRTSDDDDHKHKDDDDHKHKDDDDHKKDNKDQKKDSKDQKKDDKDQKKDSKDQKKDDDDHKKKDDDDHKKKDDDDHKKDDDDHKKDDDDHHEYKKSHCKGSYKEIRDCNIQKCPKPKTCADWRSSRSWPANTENTPLPCKAGTWRNLYSKYPKTLWQKLATEYVATKLNLIIGVPPVPEVIAAVTEAETILSATCTKWLDKYTVTANQLITTFVNFNQNRAGYIAYNLGESVQFSESDEAVDVSASGPKEAPVAVIVAPSVVVGVVVVVLTIAVVWYVRRKEAKSPEMDATNTPPGTPGKKV